MRSKFETSLLIVMLGLLDALSPFAIDMYLPSFPQIAQNFSSSVERVGFSVSAYFLGFALGQILYGPLLDRYGRKRPLYAGLFIFIVASFFCAQAKTLEVFFFMRFLQSLGGCAGTVAALSMVRDFFPANESAKVISLLMLVISISPLLAPTVGSLIMAWWDWRVIFYFLSIIAILNVLMIYFLLPEGHEPDPSIKLQISAVLKEFKTISSNPQFFVYTLAGSFSFSGLFVFVAASPGIFVGTYQVPTKVYSLIFGCLAMTMIAGSQLNIWLTQKYKSSAIFRVSILAQVVFGLIFFLASLAGVLTLASTIAILLCYLVVTGITYPNAAAMALEPFSKNAGSAAALLGFLQFGVGAVISSVVGLFAIKGTLPSATVMAASAVMGLIILLVNQKSLKADLTV